jgi:hypothetical protein
VFSFCRPVVGTNLDKRVARRKTKTILLLLMMMRRRGRRRKGRKH